MQTNLQSKIVELSCPCTVGTLQSMCCRYGSQISYIMPGGYATVGAAAFSGAVTHTISISVIVFEMTGQITHCVPVLIAVLVANAIAACLQPSCYDSIILIKKLPYLPDIIPSSSGAYNFFVENFMVREIKFIWYGMTYKQLRNTLKDGRKLRGFPLVDNPDQMVLLGSIKRTELITAIEKQIGKDRYNTLVTFFCVKKLSTSCQLSLYYNINIPRKVH